MLRAKVIGNVWATKRLPEVPNGAFLEVELEGGSARMIAFDALGSGPGESVLVATGSVAAAWFPGPHPPIDALIIGSIDEPRSSA
ncbi:MAG: EutN/CcmL family microcompartment protein [Kineosporiaceae bacterium]|nr:EutN/CcmL family microcompartment protein [Kineosporiaceae bacterium]MBK8076193.1 EutN/CcmL family microcompartment protein [Kineosporiaceae bacterium]